MQWRIPSHAFASDITAKTDGTTRRIRSLAMGRGTEVTASRLGGAGSSLSPCQKDSTLMCGMTRTSRSRWSVLTARGDSVAMRTSTRMATTEAVNSLADHTQLR